MAEFGSRGAAAPASDAEQSSGARTVLGRALFAFYLALYAGFVLLNAIAPAMMERTPLAGVNLAVWYGLALIVVAFALALIYDMLCRPFDPRDPADAEARR